MKISRRSFLTLLVSVPALAKLHPGLERGDPDEILELGDPKEIWLDSPPTVFGTSARRINGPAYIFDLITSGAGGRFMLFRDIGSCLLSWDQHRMATFRWVAAPGEEIFVPNGRHMRLETVIPPETMGNENVEPDLMSWMYYRRALPKPPVSAGTPGDYVEYERRVQERARTNSRP